MRVLVTGASGKLGRQLVGLLSARGYDVRGIDIAASALGGVEVLDLRDVVGVRRAAGGCDVVCHLGNLPTLGATTESFASGFSNM